MAKVLDSSAVLAVLFEEPGWRKAWHELPGGVLNAVNAAEVLSVLVRNGMPLDEAQIALQKTMLRIIDFTSEYAVKTAELLTPKARSGGISLGDRACMATGLLLGAPVVTAERKWNALNIPGLEIELIRD